MTRPVRVIFEDDWLLAVDKPSGMATHTGAGIASGTLADWVREYLGPRAIRNDFKASPAHRLDRETSGVILIAKRRPAMVKLMDAFANGRVAKTYLALVRDAPRATQGRFDEPLKTLEPPHREQSAATAFETEEAFSGCSLLRCLPKTGRKHQIRRHLADAGHPIAGDPTYGDAAFNASMRERGELTRLFLHAARIEFAHPKDERPMTIEAPLPDDLSRVLERLRSLPR